MARATTKQDLIMAADGQFGKLWALINSMSDVMQGRSFGSEMATAGKETHWGRDKNLRDVLVHLYEWHQLLLNWIHTNCAGGQSSFLPEPYNWRTYPVMNVEFWKKHQTTSLIDAKEMLKTSHREVMALIETFSNDELFAEKVFKWTGNSILGGYCVSATSSHYDWAMKKIKLHIKQANP
jgi:hypothetical protein